MKVVTEGHTNELINWELQALGRASDDARGRVRNRHFAYGALAMAAFVWN